MPLVEPRESQVTINFHGFHKLPIAEFRLSISKSQIEWEPRHVAGRIKKIVDCRMTNADLQIANRKSLFAGLSFLILDTSRNCRLPSSDCRFSNRKTKTNCIVDCRMPNADLQISNRKPQIANRYSALSSCFVSQSACRFWLSKMAPKSLASITPLGLISPIK